jgi:hypothetical protein
MAETTNKPITTHADEKSKDQEPATSKEREDRKSKAVDVNKLNENPKFDLPVSTITTAEDAYQAFLREEIDEDELRAAVSATGGNFYPYDARLERPDNAFKRSIPEDLYDDPSIAVTSVEDRLKEVEERDKRAEKATKASEEAESNFGAAEKALDPSVQANIKNDAAAKAVADDNKSSTKSETTSSKS